ncbi:MAG: hypothetical protein JKY12_02655 [Sneathiella sp.]|nr:hypothetical protein [Sneathiella sp.]
MVDCSYGMMAGMGLVGFLFFAVLILTTAALVKFLLFSNERDTDKESSNA